MLLAFSDNQFIQIFDKSKLSINDDVFISQNFMRYIINDLDFNQGAGVPIAPSLETALTKSHI